MNAAVNAVNALNEPNAPNAPNAPSRSTRGTSFSRTISRASACVLIACSLSARAQSQAAVPVSSTQTRADLTVRSLGDRVRSITHARPVLPIVVVVRDAHSYCAAIEAWRAQLIFPVLIDDGSSQAADAIGRFVRAFEPTSVIRFATDAKAVAWDTQTIDARVREVAARAISSDVEAGTPPAPAPPALPAGALGVVVYDPTDVAWPGALALASAHGQTPISASIPMRPDGALTVDEVRALQASVLASAKAAGNSETWNDRPLPDIAITLCSNTSTSVSLTQADITDLRIPQQLKSKPGEALALTDLLGRELRGPRAGRTFACVGQLTGSLAQSAERAMSAIFLPRRAKSAWLFESYGSGPPWNTYSASDGAKVLRNAGWSVTLAGGAKRTLDAWRSAARLPLDADLVLMNSSGLLYSFDLEGALGAPGDIPFARRPLLVHMIHSWSAQRPGNRWTIAGRWLERGAYAYVGSVHEPFLSAFVPTPEVAKRLSTGVPLGLAARHFDAPPWRVTILGDPLITLARPGAPAMARSNAPLPLKGEDVQALVAADLKASRYAEAINGLVMLGRDDGVCKLAHAVMNEHPDALTPGVSTTILLAANRVGDTDLIAALFPRTIDPKSARNDDDRALDVLWQALLPLRTKLADTQLDVLTAHPRPTMLASDAKVGAELIAMRRGRPAAAAYLQTLISTTTDANVRKELEAIAREYAGQ